MPFYMTNLENEFEYAYNKQMLKSPSNSKTNNVKIIITYGCFGC